MRWWCVAVALAACHADEGSAGRVEITNERGMLVVRDSMHVLEMSLASTKGFTFENVELPEIRFPGRVAMFDSAHAYWVVVWITRLGDKRPANIQRWFEDKLAKVRGKAKIVSDHGSMLRGDHPARTTDVALLVHDQYSYSRVVMVDVPEHDLDVMVLGIVLAAEPNPAQMAWLDGIAADVRAIHVSARPAPATSR